MGTLASLGIDGDLKIGEGGSEIALLKIVAKAVDPADQGGAGSFLTTVSFTAGTLTANAVVVAQPPAALEAELIPGGCIVSAADEVKLAFTATGAVTPASRTWRFLVIEPSA